MRPERRARGLAAVSRACPNISLAVTQRRQRELGERLSAQRDELHRAEEEARRRRQDEEAALAGLPSPTKRSTEIALACPCRAAAPHARR